MGHCHSVMHELFYVVISNNVNADYTNFKFLGGGEGEIDSRLGGQLQAPHPYETL